MLLTEERNPASANIDKLPTEEMLRIINDEDRKVASSITSELPQIARAVDAIAAALGVTILSVVLVFHPELFSRSEVNGRTCPAAESGSSVRKGW